MGTNPEPQNNGGYMKVQIWGALVLLGTIAFGLMYVNFTQDWGRAESIARKVDKADFCRFEDRVYEQLKSMDRKIERLLNKDRAY